VNGDILGRKQAPLKIKEMWDWDDGLIVRKWTMMAHSIAGPGDNDGTWVSVLGMEGRKAANRFSMMFSIQKL
jgi:hypothetical protein